MDLATAGVGGERCSSCRLSEEEETGTVFSTCTDLPSMSMWAP
jgi:hypothetical protein